MSASKKEILSIANLVRLDFSSCPDAEQQLAKIASQVDDVLAYMATLEGVDTSAVEPMYSPLQEWAAPREDIASKGHNAEAVLANAPEREDTFFVVPPVL